MTAQKRQRLMFGILIASVLFGLIMKPWERRGPAIVAPEPVAPAVEVASIAAAPSLPDIAYVSSWPSRDPFQQVIVNTQAPSASKVENASIGTPTFALQGIMTVGGELACVIDGATRTVGASVTGWRIEKIEALGVWVSQGGERHYVPLQ